MIKNIIMGTAALLGTHAALFTAAAVKVGKESLSDKFCDVVIILGCKVNGDTPSENLVSRIERAAEYLKMHPCCIAIATGGNFRDGQKISEAQVIKDGLINLGIDPEHIILEENATTTYENFENCITIIESLNLENPIVGILSNDYHLFRAGLIAEDSGLHNTVKIGAKSPNPIASYVRENQVIFEVWGKRLKKLFTK